MSEPRPRRQRRDLSCANVSPRSGALIPSDGVAVVDRRRLDAPKAHAAGRSVAAFGGLDQRARRRAGVWSTHAAYRATSPHAAHYAADASGVLAVPLSQLPRDYLFFFRKRTGADARTGAAIPIRTIRAARNGDRLSPRKSFEIWKETVDASDPRPWTRTDQQTAEAARVRLAGNHDASVRGAGTERREADVRQRTLNEELNHRVKNILALIKSLVSQDAGRRARTSRSTRLR